MADVSRETDPLTFPSHDGAVQARVAHGRKCVVVVIEPAATRWAAGVHGSIVLAPADARALGHRLIEQANASETPSG